MSCHISALCITLPCPKRGLVETTLGRGISWRVEKTPISPPSKHQQHLSLPLHFVVAGGHLLRRALSTSLPQLLTKKEEFSTYPSSGFCWRDTQHTEGESCSVMSGRCGHTVPVFSVEDGLTDQTAVLCSISCLLYSWSWESLYPLISERLPTQVIDSELIIFSVGVLVTGSLELIVTRQVVKDASVTPMKCIYKLCLVYNCQNKQVVFSAKGCHL